MNIAVLLSGGVDSSVALHLLLDQGHTRVTAFYLKVWLEDDVFGPGLCPWEEDLTYARKVCARAGVPLEVISLQAEYYRQVVEYALDELRQGRTPSPDIFCNRRIKFGAFLDRIHASFNKVATGHYARVAERDGLFWLSRGVDPVKDQTYFLSRMHQAQLARSLFPVGGLTKAEVRAYAERNELPTARRKDSQGICFLGKIKFSDFIRFHLGDRPGEIREKESGRTLGEHRGYWYHTLGQRRGLCLSGGPWFVVGKDVEANVVLVSHQDTASSHGRRVIPVEEAHWITRPPAGERLLVKVRHSPEIQGCSLVQEGEGRGTVTLDEPDPGAAPGQFIVFYDGDVCLGSARIGDLPPDS